MSISPLPAQQKYLGAKGLIALITLLSAFVPLSTDLYLPALPGMGDYFGAPIEQINLTLTVFFIFYSVGSLVWGPLCDRYGRKPVLLVGLTVYSAASAMCALAWSAGVLIIFRALQAAGGSAAGAVATAIVKDVYSGRKRESVLALVQSMGMIAPMVAPMIGAMLLTLVSWRGVFFALTAIGVVALLAALTMEETIQARSTGMLLASFARLGKVLQNRAFTMLMLLFSLGSISGMAYVASSTYIYQDGFGLSSQAYSFYFAMNAIGLVSGPMLYMRISRRIHPESIIRTCFMVSMTSGILLILVGRFQPWIFFLCLLPSSIAGSCMRPPATNLMLEQHKSDTGSMASVMSCTGMLFGSLGMTLISLPWGSPVIALGALTLLTASLSLFSWPFVIKRAQRPPNMRRLEPLEAAK